MIAYRGPTLITEPELRWPIVLLAAAITALLAMLTGSVLRGHDTVHRQI